MNILIPDLHEDAAALRQQLPRHHQPIAQIRQIRVNPIPPRIPKRLDLLRLPAQPFRLALLHVARARARLPVAGEPNAVGWVQVDHLHLAAQTLLLRQAVHHQQRIAQDHPVRPVLRVRVELQLRLRVGDPIKPAEQIGLRRRARPALALQVADQRLGQHLLLDVDRHRRHAQRHGILRVLAAPDELRVEVGIARIEQGRRRILRLLHQRGRLRGRDVAAGHVGGVAQCFQSGGLGRRVAFLPGRHFPSPEGLWRGARGWVPAFAGMNGGEAGWRNSPRAFPRKRESSLHSPKSSARSRQCGFACSIK